MTQTETSTDTLPSDLVHFNPSARKPKTA